MKLLLFPALLALLPSGCAPAAHSSGPPAAAPTPMQTERWALFDSARQRAIPVVLYRPAVHPAHQLKPAILSHGYGAKNTDYSFVAQELVAHGYVVASIQHELPTDAPMPTTGNVREVRQPFWERGVQNILFVRQALRRKFPPLDFAELLLVGHSNGGDTAMLCAAEHPNLIARVISLDNRRMPFPRAARPQVLSLRSSDQVADPGVLPTPAEQAQHGVTIVQLRNTIHNDMYDGATAAQKREMQAAIASFLAE